MKIKKKMTCEDLVTRSPGLFILGPRETRVGVLDPTGTPVWNMCNLSGHPVSTLGCPNLASGKIPGTLVQYYHLQMYTAVADKPTDLRPAANYCCRYSLTDVFRSLDDGSGPCLKLSLDHLPIWTRGVCVGNRITTLCM